MRTHVCRLIIRHLTELETRQSTMAICTLQNQRVQELLNPRSWKPQNNRGQGCSAGLRLKAWKPPEELLICVHAERLKELETNVHR